MGMLDDMGVKVAGISGSYTVGTNVFLSLLPETPDVCTALFEDRGSKGQYTIGGDGLPEWENLALQFIHRNTDYATGRTAADLIYRTLTAVANETINSDYYLRIEAVASPVLFERDDSRRVLFTCNFDVMRSTPASAGG